MAVDSKKILKNTIYLYMRMVITMIITIFSSRIVLNSLGIDGYGTYNIIFGIVVLFYFVQSALNTSTLKFISGSLVEHDEEGQIRIFNASLHASSLLIFIVFILLETVGLYIVLNILKIESQYRQTANICYQILIAVYLIQLIRVPFTSSIVSNQRMSFYALVSIVEAILKFISALLLLVGGSNKLILYCVYLFCTSLICTLWTIFYCNIKFKSCVLNYSIHIKSLKTIFSYSSWTTLSSMANSLTQQGGNILMNIYYGVTVNAAWGIAHQVNTAFASLASSLQMAFNPQINQVFAKNEFDNLRLLIYRASYLSYYLIILLGIPIICNVHYVLTLWLKTPPDYSFSFCCWIIIFQMIDTLQGPFNIVLYASGKIKFYNIWLSSILLLNIVISAILLFNGFSPVCVPVTMVILNFITGILRLLHIQYILKIKLNNFYTKYLSRMLFVTSIGFCLSYYIHKFGIMLGMSGLINLIISIVVLFLLIVIIGITRTERKRMLELLMQRFS